MTARTEAQTRADRKYYQSHKEEIIDYHRKYRASHRDKMKESIEKLEKAVFCNILKKHKNDLSNDPERLSTDFILSEVKKLNVRRKT